MCPKHLCVSTYVGPYMQLSLYLSNKISEERAASVADERPSFEEIHCTYGGCFAKLLVAGGKPFNYGTNKALLVFVLCT